MKLYYIQHLRLFSISDPISRAKLQTYKIVYRDIKSNSIRSKTITTTSNSDAYNKFIKSDDLKKSNIVPMDIRVFQIPNQVIQSEEYKTKLKEKLNKDINQ